MLSVELTNREDMIMNFWTMIAFIVAICAISDIIKSRNNKSVNKSVTHDENLSMLLGRLKNRVENLETIVLEEQRNRRFAKID